ncbi:hypothetical protein R0L47_12880 [Pectobacterium polonicum]|uniref:Uncharacterized protein n=1 Tax=Pectobacterium polonicum TaxID=2485124 RepID=A0AAE9NPJ4_9GAMM|nr:hypothetical protein [Pectobacterium polonicum]MDC9821210.1 hypothetical protein [Pectobacterium polonicum]TKY81321.1 hypothetical protein EDI29_16290 [Pectobacterium polonicum]UVO07420.1 hypothetical protein LW347_16245 [Pectobacterium polonicum]
MIINMLNEITNGYDGVIKNINFISFESAIVEVSVIRRTDREWVNVIFELKGLVEFAVKKRIKCSNTVMSNGISYKYIEDIHYIDFSPYSDDMDDVNDYRMSDVYFATKEIKYSINPYSDI